MTLHCARFQLNLAVGLILAATTLMGSSSRAAIIAHWPFEPNDLTADISGNGHTLVNNGGGGAVAGAASPASGSTGSAMFDGNDWMGTIDSIDLSPYDIVRISWWQQITKTTVAIGWEHTSNYNTNDHAIGLTLNEFGTGVGGALQQEGWVSGVSPGRYNVDRYAHDTSGTWQRIVVEYDHTVADPAHMLRIFVDGSVANIADSRNELQTDFANDAFFIGARNGGVIPIIGSYDEFMIEGFVVPEPSTVVLSGIGACVLLLSAGLRRCRRGVL